VDGATKEDLLYDDLGRRIRKNGDYEHWDGRSLVAETDAASGGLLRGYTHGLALLREDVLGNMVEAYTDGMGSVGALVPQNGNASSAGHYRYDAYGNFRTEAHPGDCSADPSGLTCNAPLTYTGHLYDAESNLFYFGARYYDPETGRFLTNDPVAGDALNPPSLHKYLYTYDSPMVFTDPWGERSDEELAARADAAEKNYDPLNSRPTEPLNIDDLQVPQGYFYTQYLAAKEYASDRRNPWLARQGMAIMQGLSAFIAWPEEYVLRGTANTPHAVIKGAQVGGQVLGEGIAEKDPYRIYEGSMTLYTAGTVALAAATPASSELHVAPSAPRARIVTENGVQAVEPVAQEAVTAETPKPAPKQTPPNAVEPAPARLPTPSGELVPAGFGPRSLGAAAADNTAFAGNANGAAAAQGSIRYGELDALGRPTMVEATITEDMIGTGSSASKGIQPPGFGGGAVGHARGHLLGNQLGGSGKEVRNLITIYQNPANTPVMSGFESQVRAAVEGGEVVQYRITPIYNGSAPMPVGITLEASGSNGFRLQVSVLNKK
jgi:RHS repeat-associated protein